MQLPITSRTMLFERLRDGTFRHLDFNLVNTSLGAMIEPRTLIRANGAMRNEDVYESAFTDWLVLDGATIGQFGLTACNQWPRVFNTL